MPATISVPTESKVHHCFLPAVGLGTFQGDLGNSLVKQTVAAALRKGCRHIDAAAAYGNEKEIGEALKESGFRRNEVFFSTTKL